MDAILVLNAGSSSVKFAAFEQVGVDADLHLIARGHVSLSAGNVELVVHGDHGECLESKHYRMTDVEFDADASMALLFDWIDAHRGGLRLLAVGHRVVHGGAGFSEPVVVDERVMQSLDALVPLAPLHQPHNLNAIRVAGQRWPGVTQIACFDTAFHATQPHVAKAFALPRDITDSGVQRYGFHGLSYEYIATQMSRVLGDATSRGKVIVAHLGNGASLCAMSNKESVASSMGFSALDGLVMGTRCGTLDPGVLLYLIENHGLDVKQLTDLLYRRSGLLGVSGISGDMQVLLDSDDPAAAEAVELFVYRIVCEIGALAAAMGGLDAIVFTAGIGEHAAPIRARVIAGCSWLRTTLNAPSNDQGLERIEGEGSAIRIGVIPTDEERMIAVHTHRMSRVATL